MNQVEFKSKLDNRKFYGHQSKEVWEAAFEWQDQANEDDGFIMWSWDSGLKLDYDGDVCRISSRFYPPHKSSSDYLKYHGSINVMVGDVSIHKHDVEASTLDELKSVVEEYVFQTIAKIESAIVGLF